MADDTPYQQIKQRVLCGTCTAAKFMFWTADELDDKPSGLTRDRTTGLAYLIRCDYFRLTVQSPHALQHCEGYKGKT
jgi:hypothetical protein